MTRSRTVVSVLCVVSVLALGACSGSDPEPRFAPPSSSAPSSPSTTAVSGPVEPTMPAAARGTDAAAAEAFVRFYWEMVNYAQATGDLDGLRNLTRPECAPCESGLRGLQRLIAREADLHGGVYRLADVSSAFFDEGTRITVWYALAASRQVIGYPGERADQVYPAKQVRAMSVLRKDGNGWALEYWGEDPSQR